eukprot:TRINITY_DN6619_c4_g1_i1.p1 TRINITY_DN6619_c4_g1~~TRINITY_DN6619_c4_g1_i1.p1  ORF type:complete len:647 (+),score=82.60 TRINITY_DN6619_c4_g1_i1:61-2001(+)
MNGDEYNNNVTQQLLNEKEQVDDTTARAVSRSKRSRTGIAIWVFMIICVTVLLILLLLDDDIEKDTLLVFKWTLLVLLTLGTILESEWGKELQLKKAISYIVSHHGHSDRIAHLTTQVGLHHHKKRNFMTDIVDTILEKAYYNLIHQHGWRIALEAAAKKRLNSTLVSAVSESGVIDWSSQRYPSVGDSCEFGDDVRRTYFPHLTPGYLDIATLSPVPSVVLEARKLWDRECQKDTCDWRLGLTGIFFRIPQVRSMIAAHFSSDPNDVVLCQNGCEAVISVLRSLPWEVGDILFIIKSEGDFCYSNTGVWLTERYGVQVVELEIKLPAFDNEIVKQVDEDLKKRITKPKVAIFNHVQGNGWLMPASAIRHTLHKYGTSVMIDGTLAVGQHVVKINEIRPDWYAASCSSFLLGMPGCGFLVAAPLKQGTTQPLIVSYYDGNGYEDEFSYCGLRDFSNWLSLMESLDFVRKKCSAERARQYCRRIAHRGERVIKAQWGVGPLQGERPTVGDIIELTPGQGTDACIRFPHETAAIIKDDYGTRPYKVDSTRGIQLYYDLHQIRLKNSKGSCDYAQMPTFKVPSSEGKTSQQAAKLQHLLVGRGVTCTVFSAKFGAPEPSLYVRCSVGIYNTIDDFKVLAKVVPQLHGRY